MNTMLTAWGAPRLRPGSMSGMGMSGMMSDQQMGQLIAASGPAFDLMFMQMMIEHHRGGHRDRRDGAAAGPDEMGQLLARI